MSTFAKALTYYLAVKGKTQQDLINDLHYSSSTVSQWCTGKNTPRMDRIEAALPCGTALHPAAPAL